MRTFAWWIVGAMVVISAGCLISSYQESLAVDRYAGASMPGIGSRLTRWLEAGVAAAGGRRHVSARRDDGGHRHPGVHRAGGDVTAPRANVMPTNGRRTTLRSKWRRRHAECMRLPLLIIGATLKGDG